MSLIITLDLGGGRAYRADYKLTEEEIAALAPVPPVAMEAEALSAEFDVQRSIREGLEVKARTALGALVRQARQG